LTGRQAVFLSAVAFWLASGCAGTLKPAFPIADARVALQQRELTVKGLTSIRAEARVDQRAKEGRIRGTVLMLVEASGRVRFDVMTQFGPIAILSSDGTQFAYSDFRAQRYLTGDTCPQNIARLLGVPLTAEETARFLLGGTPVLTYDKADLTLGADDGHYHLTLHAGDGQKQQLELAVYPSDMKLPANKQRLYLVRSELWNKAGGRVWRVTYDEPEPVALGQEQLLVPMRVRIEQTTPASDTLVHFKSVKSNPSLPDDAFVQTPRPGMSEETASCE
jgi:hypothetical protein